MTPAVLSDRHRNHPASAGRCVLSICPRQLLLVTESVLCCPRLSVRASGPVLRSCLTEALCSHKTVFKGERSAPCLRSPSAMSVPLVRDSCSPGAIRSQAEGGMSLTSKSQTGQRGEKNTPHTRAHSTARMHARCLKNIWIY